MPSSRGCRSSYDCIVKIKGITTRPILFSQLMRSDGEGGDEPRGAVRRRPQPRLRAAARPRGRAALAHAQHTRLGDILSERVQPRNGACGSGMRICWRNGTRSGTGPSSRPTSRAAIPPECGGAASAATVGSCPRGRGRSTTPGPYCGRRLTLEGFNSAECLDAGILHLWHSTKNGDLKPSQVSDRTARGSGCNARRAGTNGVRACGGLAKGAASARRAMGEGDTISPRAATTSGQRGRTSPGSSTPS